MTNDAKTQHTPFEGAPWETSTFVASDGRVEWSICEADGGDVIAAIYCDGNEELNARLIAAAPELLEALQKFTCISSIPRGRNSEVGPEYQTALANAHAALAKAEGKL